MDEETEVAEFPSVGERLRAAREEKGFSLEEIATQTRIPQRHLESLEASDWSRLPAPTYTIGFAKSYASAVELDRTEIGEQLRTEMSGHRSEYTEMEVFEPVDPARTMPRWLVLSALGAIVLLVGAMSWLRNRSLEGPESAGPTPGAVNTPRSQVPGAATAPQQPPQPAPAARGPVVLTATEPAWIHITDGGKTLFQGVLAGGQSYEVPQTATAPLLKAGKPEALRVTVGGAA